MTDPVASAAPSNVWPPSEEANGGVLPKTKTQLRDAAYPNGDPYAMIDELGIPRDHPFLQLLEEAEQRSKRGIRAKKRQSDQKT